ncbi:MAG TPA: caspase family protein [Nitrospira sp.]|nr:caspase family protein [Nitrospira sp.]
MSAAIRFRAVLVLLVALWTVRDDQWVAAQPAQDQRGGTKRALLIGINKYRAVPKLQGSLNDVETMRQVLITRWGFPESNIQFLKDEQATRDGILAALKQFVGETGPNDTVYIHYSGHGSQVADLNGDEPDDKLDETLVPQDGRTGTVPDITDDELDAIFSRLSTKHAFIVLDSCHSGTATRSLDIRTRSVPQDTRVELYRHLSDSGVRTRGTIQMLPAHYVLMTGAASHQEALDGPVDGRYHGFFSYALSKSLSASPAAASPREIFRGIETELKRIQTHFGRASMPEPQLEAPPELLDMPLLAAQGGAATAADTRPASRLAWLDVIGADAGRATLVNGLLLGAAPGSTWAIYPPGEVNFRPGQAVAIATVTDVAGKDVKTTYHPADKKIADKSRAVSLMPAPTGERIPIHILDTAGSRRKQIEETLAQYLPNAELVGADQSPRYLVQQQDRDIQLLTADGLQVVGSFGGDGAAWGAGLALVVTRSATASELLTLDNPSSQLKIELRVANAPAATKPKIGTRGIAVVAADTQPARYRIRKSGKPRTAENTLQLEVSVNADAYLTIIDVDSEGGVNLLFPNDYAKPDFYPDGFIKAGAPVLIPDSLLDSNKAGFYWDYSPPKGMDTVRVFSSTDLETANMIRQRIKDIQAAAVKTKGKVGTRSVVQDFQGLRDGLARRAVRGIVTVYDPTPHVPGEMASAPAAGATPPPQEPVAEPVRQPQTAVPTTVQTDTPRPAPDWAAASITIKVEG